MKTGCLCVLLVIIGTFVLAVLFGLVVELLPGLSANWEGIGTLVGISWWILFPAGFIYGYRIQRKKQAKKAALDTRPEKLRPVNLGGLKDALSATDKNKNKKT